MIKLFIWFIKEQPSDDMILKLLDELLEIYNKDQVTCLPRRLCWFSSIQQTRRYMSSLAQLRFRGVFCRSVAIVWLT